MRLFSFIYNADKCRKYKVLTAAFAFLIFILSVQQPTGSAIAGFPLVDKLFHITAYFILCLLASKALEKRDNFFELAFIFAISYGFLMEFTQLFISARNFEFLDILANTLGASLVYFGVKYNLNVFKRENGYMSFLR